MKLSLLCFGHLYKKKGPSSPKIERALTVHII